MNRRHVNVFGVRLASSADRLSVVISYLYIPLIFFRTSHIYDSVLFFKYFENFSNELEKHAAWFQSIVV